MFTFSLPPDNPEATHVALTKLLDMVAVRDRVTVFAEGSTHASLDVAILSSILNVRRLDAGPLKVGS